MTIDRLTIDALCGQPSHLRPPQLPRIHEVLRAWLASLGQQLAARGHDPLPSNMSDRMLEDIGLTRHDLDCLKRPPSCKL